MAQHELSEELYQGVADPDPEATSDAERLALRYAELFVADHLSIDEAFFDELRGEFSDAEIVELSLSMSLWLGLGRFTQVIGAAQSCPIRL